MRKKELVTYQLKAYQDLKYRANRLPNNEAETLDILPDVPEKRKFKPDYLKDNDIRKKEKTLKLRNLSDFSKIDNHLADNLKEANKNSKTSSVTEIADTKSISSVTTTKSNSSINNTNSQTGYNLLNLGRTFSLNRKPNPSSTHGSTVDIDVIEVSSPSSYSEDEEETKIIKNESQSTAVVGDGANTENDEADDEDSKSNTTSSSVNVEIHQDDKNTSTDNVKTNILNDKVNSDKLPLDPNTKNERRTLKLPHKKDKSGKRTEKNKLSSSLDFSSFINNLSLGNNAKRSNLPPMTATSVINSIFSFLNNSIKEEKPMAPVHQTPASPPLPESSQESNDESLQITPLHHHDSAENNEKTKEVEVNTSDNTNNIIAPTPLRPSPEPLKDEKNSNSDKNIDNNTKDSNIPIITINDKNVVKEDNEITKDKDSSKDENENVNGEEKKESTVQSSLSHNDKISNQLNHSNARMDLSLQPTSPDEIRKKKLTPLLVSKKGAAVLIKFLEKNINVVPEMKITEIEWVCMQNPRGTFTTKRPQCPGQRFPGLKMGRKISNLMVSLAIIKGKHIKIDNFNI